MKLDVPDLKEDTPAPRRAPPKQSAVQKAKASVFDADEPSASVRTNNCFTLMGSVLLVVVSSLAVSSLVVSSLV